MDLIEAVETSTRGNDEGKIKIHAYFRKTWEMATADGIKTSQLEGHGVSIVSRIIEIERKSKIKFEHAYVNAKKIENN